jgi:holo-[acyl-carrier protein] synthase
MALRVGLDLVAVSTVVESLRGAHRERYLERVYTAREVKDCGGPSDAGLAPERLAARFAAKEAAIKALPGAEEGVSLTQIEVVRGDDGSVSLRLTDRAAELFAASGAAEIAVSLTHELDLVAAVVVLT